jgi:hypothetical protein
MPPFSESEISVIRERWGSESNSAIGRRIGRSKSSVGGKARRLGLPIGESPIGKKGPRPKPRNDAPMARPVAAPRSIVQLAKVIGFAAGDPAAALELGTPGVWRAPVTLTWSQIQTIAAQSFVHMRSKDHLIGFNRSRVAVGLAPLAIALAPPGKGKTHDSKLTIRSLPWRPGGAL